MASDGRYRAAARASAGMAVLAAGAAVLALAAVALPAPATDGGRAAVALATLTVAALAWLVDSLRRRDAAERALAAREERLALALAGASDGLWDWDLDTGAVFYSPRWKEMLGLGGADLPGTVETWRARVHPDDLAAAEAVIRRHLDDGAECRFEHRLRHADGGWRWILSRGRAVRDAAGRPTRLVGTHTDVTAEKEQAAALAVVNHRLAEAQRIAKLGNWEFTVATGRLWWSDEAFRLAGWEPGSREPSQAALRAMIPVEEHALMDEHMAITIAKGRTVMEHRLRRPDGTEVMIREHAEAVYDDDGRPVRLIGTSQDVTEEHRRALHARQLALAIEQSPVGIVMTDAEGVIRFVNPAVTAMSGYAAEELVGATPRLLKSNVHGQEFYRALWAQIRAGEPWHGEIVNRRKDGVLYWEEMTITPVKDDHGALAGFIALKRDVTERKTMLERIENLAYYDPLTGLPNRTLFQQRLDYLEGLCRRTDKLAALLFLDIDGFKQTNDALGHEVGDEVLRIAGQRLTACLRRVDMAARLGGDEFAVALLLDAGDTAQATAVAQRMIDSIGEPMRIGATEVRVGASIGIALHPPHGPDIGGCLRRADLAMYAAKNAGKGRWQMVEADAAPDG